MRHSGESWNLSSLLLKTKGFQLSLE